MKSHKRQHFVPQCYLRAWCDPNTPSGQEPYVWLFNKDGSGPKRKAPENIFHETDLYTIHQVDGGRDLVLEHGLAGLESEFVAVRDAKLAKGEKITVREHVMLCAFIAAAHARTPAERDHHGGQWAKVLEKMERMKEWAKTATPEQKRAASTIASGSGPSLGYDDVKLLAEKPLQTMLPPMVGEATPLLVRLDFLVFVSSGSAFITSDHPCVWFDPEGYKRPPMYQAPALIYKSIEITLPVSPRQLILLNRRGFSGYRDAPERVVDEYNRRTRFQCAEYFVSNSSATKAIWFDPGVEPEDSWRKRNPERRPLKPPPRTASSRRREGPLAGPALPEPR
jgi:Protein of unknown function (DUF4238)